MRILFVAPYPLSRIRIRSYGFVQQLAKQHDVTALLLCSNQCEMNDIQTLQQEGLRVFPVLDKKLWKAWRLLCVSFTSQPLQVAFDASPHFQSALNDLLAQEKFDILHVEFIRILGALPQHLPIPAIWDAVDCISQLYEHGARYGATPMLRLIGKQEALRTRAYEFSQLRRFQHVLVTSPRDQLALNAIGQDNNLGKITQPAAPITALPHGVDLEYYQYSQGVRQRDTLIFSGKMSFHANVAGVLHLVKNIMPLIWSQRPQVQLIIAGSKPPKSIRRLARDPRITVTGHVDDLRPFIRNAYIAVCPLPYAVGMQNKVVEAMALGTPVVASSHVATGLQVIPEQDILVADDPHLFAQAVLQLLDEPQRWQAIAQNGRAYIEKYHNWNNIIDTLIAIYTKVIKDASSNNSSTRSQYVLSNHNTKTINPYTPGIC